MIQFPEYHIDPIVAQLIFAAEMQKLTQVEMARIDGVRPETWRSWKYGQHSPTLDKLHRRARTLGYAILLNKLPERPKHDDDR